MSLPINLTDLTPEELRTILSQISAELANREQQAQTEAIQLKDEISNGISTISALIGPVDKEGTTPDLETINGVLRYSPAEMAANPQIAFPLAFQGLLILAEATEKIAMAVVTGE